MPGPLHQYLAGDHDRLAVLLDEASARPGEVEPTAYEAFRAGLLRHIGIEERILFPLARRARGGDPLPVVAQLHRDHAALAALLVPPPTTEIIATIQALLDEHNVLEEEDGGLYEACEHFAGEELDALVAQVRTAPEIPVAPHFDTPNVHQNIQVLLAARTANQDTGGHPPPA
jgi:hypothetical protein